MDKGTVGEYLSPQELLADRRSMLSTMVDKMGPTATAAMRQQVGA